MSTYLMKLFSIYNNDDNVNSINWTEWIVMIWLFVGLAGSLKDKPIRAIDKMNRFQVYGRPGLHPERERNLFNTNELKSHHN